MKLNTNSLLAQIYRSFYEVGYMPDNLCSYFWKLIIACIFYPFYLICSFPIIVIDRFKEYIKTKYNRYCPSIEWFYNNK